MSNSMLHITPSRHISNHTDTYRTKQPHIWFFKAFLSFWLSMYLSGTIHTCLIGYVTNQTIMYLVFFVFVPIHTCLAWYMSVIFDMYPVFFFFLHFLQTYIGQTCLMSVITFRWFTIPIHIASFMFFVCHKSGKPDTYRIWATCDRLLALLARRITVCRDLYMVFVLIFFKMGGYVRVLCPVHCPFC